MSRNPNTVYVGVSDVPYLRVRAIDDVPDGRPSVGHGIVIEPAQPGPLVLSSRGARQLEEIVARLVRS